MSTQSLIDAARLTPPEQPVDWAHAEQHLDMHLPADYRQLVSAGGAGVWFNDLRLYAPGDPVRSHDLLNSNGVFEDLLLFWEDDPEMRRRTYSKTHGWLLGLPTVMVRVRQDPHRLHDDTTPEMAAAHGLHDARPEELDG